ncbi:MAG: hypothetical protein HQK54_15755, partial [Oligoflexales bacterium]|nr:hypothetical protein [Oligoflexales bacterium]
VGNREGDEFVLGDVLSIGSSGRVFEKMTGFKGKVMRVDNSRLTLDEILSPGDRDPKIFLERTCGFIESIKVDDIGYNMAYIPDLRTTDDEVRYELFQKLIEESFPRMSKASKFKGKKVAVEIEDDKKLPSVMIGDEKWNFDYCYTDYHAIVYVADRRLSCSIARVYDRSNEQEIKDIVSGYKDAYEALIRYGDSEELTLARLIAVKSALAKLDFKGQAELTLDEYKEKSVSFNLANADKMKILTYDVTLARGGRYVMSLIFTEEGGTMTTPNFSCSA